jgi:hypothetical protein
VNILRLKARGWIRHKQPVRERETYLLRMRSVCY